jgi:hypothetical protein
LPNGIAYSAIKDRQIAIASILAIKERRIIIAYLVIKIELSYQRLLSNIRTPHG